MIRVIVRINEALVTQKLLKELMITYWIRSGSCGFLADNSQIALVELLNKVRQHGSVVFDGGGILSLQRFFETRHQRF